MLMRKDNKTVTVQYFGFLGGKRGTHTETYQTQANTARELLHEIQAGTTIKLATNITKAAINDQFVDWDAEIKDGDQVTFVPPFSGG